MSISFSITGDDVEFTLTLDAWAYPADTDYWDGNWIRAAVQLTSRSSGTFTAQRTVNARSNELAGFRDGLREALTDPASAETVGLFHLEENFGIEIEFASGQAEAALYVADDFGARLDVDQVELDGPALQQLLRDLEIVTGEFPVRGNGEDPDAGGERIPYVGA